jgi:hypothetical protein
MHPSAARGAIIGMVDLTGICECGQTDDWAIEGHHHWCLEHPRLFDQPIPYRGRQSIYKVSEPEVIAAVDRQINRVPDFGGFATLDAFRKAGGLDAAPTEL